MAVLAVAQHYGIPTHLVDFTLDPDVAGFFSYDTPKAVPQNLESVIVCLNTEDLMRVRLPDQMPKPECLVKEVTDLWRLQAQHGVFLVCPYDHFEQVVYGFDRIVFPYGVPGSIDPTTIYPARKSQLEIALDHYFAEERVALRRRECSRSGSNRLSYLSILNQIDHLTGPRRSREKSISSHRGNLTASALGHSFRMKDLVVGADGLFLSISETSP
jgi:hypothetical protein